MVKHNVAPCDGEEWERGGHEHAWDQAEHKGGETYRGDVIALTCSSIGATHTATHSHTQPQPQTHEQRVSDIAFLSKAVCVPTIIPVAVLGLHNDLTGKRRDECGSFKARSTQ